MGTSGNPAKKAQTSSVADFKKRKQGDLELPSGLRVKVRNPGGLRVLMVNGTIPNSLMPMVQKSLDEGKAVATKDALDDVDPQTIAEMMEMMDNIAVSCLVEPRCYLPPEDSSDRDDDLLYTDEVDDEDKMFLFQWISGGTRDVEKFRAEQASGVAALVGQQEVGGTPE